MDSRIINTPIKISQNVYLANSKREVFKRKFSFFQQQNFRI
jgi:hypothetical protein